MSIQMLDCLFKTEESLLQTNLEVEIKVVTDTLKIWMSFLCDHESDIALNLVGHLFSLSLKNDCVAILHARLNVYLESLAL